MVKILTDIHKADAMLTVSYEVRNRFGGFDSLYYSDYILRQYHYTRAQFDSTISWLSGNPEEYEKIYDKVLKRLSKEEGELDLLQKKTPAPPPVVNIWSRKRDWNLPLDGPTETIHFDFPVKGAGTYTISFQARIFSDDRSVNPHLTASFWYDDHSPEGHNDSFSPATYPKTGEWKNYNVAKVLNDPKATRLRGQILDADERKGNWRKHCEVRNISILYKPLPSPAKDTTLTKK